MEPAGAIDEVEVAAAEANDVAAVPLLGEPDRLPSQGFADVACRSLAPWDKPTAVRLAPSLALITDHSPHSPLPAGERTAPP